MARIFTGAKAKLKINGEVFAFASGVSVNEDNTLQRIDVLGEIASADLAETGHAPSCTIQSFKVVNPEIVQTATKMGIGATDDVIQNLRDRAYFDVEIMDDQNRSVYKITDAKWAGGSGQVDARGVWTGSWNIEGREGRGL